VFVAVIGALVVLGVYHALFTMPRLRRISAVLDAHDALLGGGAAKATDRIADLERHAADAQAVRGAVEGRLVALERVAQSEVPRIGFVRYNALLNKTGDGVVISSIWSREETRTYGKAVQNFTSAQDASVEERAAIAKAKAATS
jgi:hypothetical protein